MPIEVKKEGKKVHIDINPKICKKYKRVMPISSIIFLVIILALLSYGVYTNQFEDDELYIPIITGVFFTIVLIIIAYFSAKINFYIEKDLSSGRFTIVVPIGIPLQTSILKLSSQKTKTYDKLVRIKAARSGRGLLVKKGMVTTFAESIGSPFKKIYTLILVFSDREVTLFSPAYLHKYRKIAAADFWVTKEDAIKIAKTLNVPIKFEEIN